jgi:NAD-dependent histone deacetylase SIR2
VERDLKGTGRKGEKEGQVDLLLVAGTSLSIPGVKRIVKEMARSLHSRAKSKSKGKGPKTILINREIPKGAEWQGVFDTFICGDIQEFAAHCADSPVSEVFRPTPLKRKFGKAESTPKKISQINPYPTPSPTPLRKRPKNTAEPVTPTKPRLESILELPDTPLSMEKGIVPKSPYATTPESLEKKTYNYDLPASPTSLKSRSLSLSPLPARFDGA